MTLRFKQLRYPNNTGLFDPKSIAESPRESKELFYQSIVTALSTIKEYVILVTGEPDKTNGTELENMELSNVVKLLRSELDILVSAAEALVCDDLKDGEYWQSTSRELVQSIYEEGSKIAD